MIKPARAVRIARELAGSQGIPVYLENCALLSSDSESRAIMLGSIPPHGQASAAADTIAHT